MYGENKVQNTLVFMRTHIITKGVLSEFQKLKNSHLENCVLFIDNHTHFIDAPSGYQKLKFLDYDEEFNCFLFDEEVFKSLDLPMFAKRNKNKKLKNVMWYCADYAFYVMRKYYPDYKYYWQFDYDVFLNGKSYFTFFDKYKCDEADLIIANFRKVCDYDEWPWIKKVDWFYNTGIQKYASFFPVSRISAGAVDFLYSKRQEQKKLFFKLYKNKKYSWPNCEMFVPTELMNAGFACEALQDHYLRFSPNYDLNEDRVFENPDNKIYHPVKGNYEQNIFKLNSKIFNLTRLSVTMFGLRLGVFIEHK